MRTRRTYGADGTSGTRRANGTRGASGTSGTSRTHRALWARRTSGAGRTGHRGKIADTGVEADGDRERVVLQAPVRAHHDHVIAAGRQILRQGHDQLLRRPAQEVELQAGEPHGDVAVTELTTQRHVPLVQLRIGPRPAAIDQRRAGSMAVEALT